VAAYSRIATTGAPSAAAYAQLKIAGAYQRGNRFDLADDAYRRGIRADAGTGRALLHALYQGLASLYLQRGNDPAALDALAQSARVQPDPAAPYRLRLDVAQRLLRRGHARQVLAYAEAAVRFAPEDEAAQDLRAQAQRAQASGAAAPRR
jgi:tetratricopeptide (TPR) repeat protein